MIRHTIILLSLLLLSACGNGDPKTQDTTAPEVPTATRTTDEPPHDGPHELRDAEGRLTMRGSMRDGKRHGLWTAYHTDGSIRSQITFSEGLEHGATVVFRPNGATHYTGDNRYGKPVGEWHFFSTNGTLLQIVTYDSLGNEVERR